MNVHVCIDCIVEPPATVRPAPYGGPRSRRCATHARSQKKGARQRAKEKRIERVYGISEEEYQAILAAQGGRCAVCQRANGRTKRLAVDHDHLHCGICAGPQTCGAPEAIRCLACGPCNQQLGVWNLPVLARAARVLTSPSAPEIIRRLRERQEL